MINFLSLFSGIGAPEKALDRLEIDYNLVNYCEIDKYASKSYAAVHNVSEELNLGDITKVDTSKLPRIDMICYGFPCQDISVAGKQKGLFNDDGTATRSGLFFEALRIIEDTKPKVAIAENVKNLTSKKFNAQFQVVLESLEQAGYNNYWKILNAKDYGIPQNRERVFIVSIRKDIDNGGFKFPEPFELKLRLKDLLQCEVDEKFYLSDKAIQGIKNSSYERKQHIVQEKDYCDTLLARDYKDPKCIALREETADLKTEPVRLGNVYGEQFGTGYAGNVWDKNGVSPTLMTMQGGGRQPHIVENNKLITEVYNKAIEKNLVQANDIIECTFSNARLKEIEQGYIRKQNSDNNIASTLVTTPQKLGICVEVEPFIAASRGRNPENPSDRTLGGPTEQRLEPNSQGICNTLTTVQKDNLVCEPRQIIKERFFRQAQETLKENDCKFGDTIDSFNKRVNKSGLSPTLTTRPEGFKTAILPVTNNLRIRKLTPLECWRLMGFDDEDFYKAEKVNSNTQLYKQAGNSIVIDVLVYLKRLWRY